MKSIKRLKYLLLFVILLGVLLFSIDWIISFGARHVNVSDLGKINLIFNHRVDPDIMIFGASDAEWGFDAPELQRLTHRTVYNGAIDGTHYRQLACLIDEFAQYATHNRAVILSLGPFALRARMGVREIERYLPVIGNQNVYESLYDMDADLAFKCRYIPFYKYTEVSSNYYRQSFEGWKTYIKSRRQGFPLDTMLGYVPDPQAWQRAPKNATNDASNVPIDKFTYQVLADLIRELRSKGKKVIVLVSPFHQSGVALIKNWEQIRSGMQALGAMADYYMDFSTSTLTTQKDYFRNSFHLNANGSKVFASILAEQLNRILK
ncbi:MAG: SGNH/GDSL hydrolase family protein [Bacteroidota bacterium]|nr:SGNH/GDSL hydrolase family protein [Bacteroidota bacterium]MDP4253721.1 SGNH/GDSL hydrolase family protein [Bacteroidota bacterium]MDP4259659.1 SGNH/GDSL hydrolase family protein [Bacteroidota bacterium]